MLDHVEHLRERIEAGELRALFTVEIPSDLDDPHHTWDGGDLTNAEGIGWLEQLKFRMQLRAYEVVQRGHLEDEDLDQ